MNRFPSVALGDVCDVSIGRTPRRNQSRYWGGSHPWATIRDLDGGTLTATAEGITDDAVHEVMPKPVEPRTLLFSFKLSIGKMAFAGRRMHHNEAIAALRIRDPEALDGKFLFYALKAKTHDGDANHAVLGRVLNKRKVQEIAVPLPPLNEQRRIVDILNRATRIETLRRRAAERMREFVPALFVRMFGDPGGNPMRWPQHGIGDVCDVQGGLQVSKKRSVYPLETPYLRVANVLRDRLVLDAIKLIRLTESEFARTRLRPGDLLVVEGHGDATEIGRVAVWDGRIRNCVHQNHLIRARPDQSRLLPAFAAAYLNSSSGRRHLLVRGKTTSGLNTITTSDVRTCEVFLPPLELQRRFAEIVDAARAITRMGEANTRTAAILMSSLMAQMFRTEGFEVGTPA